VTFKLRLAKVCVLAAVGFEGIFLASALDAQSPTPAPPVVANPAPAKQRIETEVIAVTRAGAYPSKIVRKPGVFFLQLVTQIPDSQLNLTLAPVVAVPDASKLQGIVDAASLQRRKISAGLVNLPSGEYQLQSLPGGKTICTITIE
jgi:hypothetical protein